MDFSQNHFRDCMVNIYTHKRKNKCKLELYLQYIENQISTEAYTAYVFMTKVNFKISLQQHFPVTMRLQ